METINRENLENQLDSFEKILNSFHNQKGVALSKRDIELLRDIKRKLEHIPQINLFDMKYKSSTSKKRRNKLSSKSARDSDLYTMSPRSPREKITFPSLVNIEDEVDDVIKEEFDFSELLQSISVIVEMILTKTDHYQKFKIAMINSQISIKTADRFVEFFGDIMLKCLSCFFCQKHVTNSEIEIYGETNRKSEVIKFYQKFENRFLMNKLMLITEEDHPQMHKELSELLELDLNTRPVYLAKRFKYRESINLFVGASDHGDISLLKMFYDNSLVDVVNDRFLTTILNIASKILFQFTVDHLNKDHIFFDLLDIEVALHASTINQLVSMLHFTYKDHPDIEILRSSSKEYQQYKQTKKYIHYKGFYSILLFEKYNFGLKIDRRMLNFSEIDLEVHRIIQDLCHKMFNKQSFSQALIKAYHKDMTKVIIHFGMNNMIINQTRHYFPFIEREFSPAYLLSSFNPERNVTLLDITKNSELRKQIMHHRDLVMKKYIQQSFEFNKTSYTITPVVNYLADEKHIGFFLTIESDSDRLMESIMQNRQTYSKRLRLKFVKSDDLEKRIHKSLKFLNQSFGASTKNVIDVLKGFEESIEKEAKDESKNDEMVKNLMAEYQRPEVMNLQKMRVRSNSVRGSPESSRLEFPILSTKGKGQGQGNRRKSFRVKGHLLDLKSIRALSISAAGADQQDYLNSLNITPQKAMQKKCKFANKQTLDIDALKPHKLKLEIDDMRSIASARSEVGSFETNYDISFLDATDVDHRQLRNSKIDFLKIESRKMVYKYIWAMFSNIQIVTNHFVSPHTFSQFIKEADRYYSQNENTFHNFKHGCMVLNVAYSLFKSSDLDQYFTQTGKTAFMFAALMHDVDHTGRNNLYEIKSYSKLAVRYNDDSVLENHHTARAFLILSVKQFNIFEKMHHNDYVLFRQYVIHAILSTDIKKHFTDLNKFKNRLDCGDFSPYEEQDDITDFLLMLGILIHSCDLYTPTLEWDASLRWSMRLNAEFRTQNRCEELQKIPLTPFYVGLNDPVKVANSEIGFINAIVWPLWSEVDRFMQGPLKSRLENIDKNLEEWKKIKEGKMKLKYLVSDQAIQKTCEDKLNMNSLTEGDPLDFKID